MPSLALISAIVWPARRMARARSRTSSYANSGGWSVSSGIPQSRAGNRQEECGTTAVPESVDEGGPCGKPAAELLEQSPRRTDAFAQSSRDSDYEVTAP